MDKGFSMSDALIVLFGCFDQVEVTITSNLFFYFRNTFSFVSTVVAMLITIIIAKAEKGYGKS